MGKHKKKKKKKLIEGIFRATESKFGFVEVENMKEDIFIPIKFVNGALDGDAVSVEIYKNAEKNRRAEGKIIKIIKREKVKVVGRFEKSEQFGFVVPDDKKLGTDIYIPKAKCKNVKNGDKVIAKIIKYPESRGKKNAEGEIIEILGHVDEAGIDMMSVVREFELRDTFPEYVIEEAKSIPQNINLDAIEQTAAESNAIEIIIDGVKRRDLRDKIVFTIDGEDAKDLDDAVAVTRLENGNYKLDVHIADVSYYVKEGSKLDKEAIKRGTSVYMMDRVIPMLPFELSNGICSLNQGTPRYALSCSMEIDDTGKVVSSEIYKSVIKVTRRMTYTNVYKILNNLDDEVTEEYKDYIDNFKAMEELAIILKNRRLNAGYINLEIPESKIYLDEDGKAINVTKYETNFANEIIEQFMLTANETVAETFFFLEAPFIYRVHESPDFDKVKETNKFLFNIGERIKASEDNITSKAFSDVLERLKGTDYERVISTLILRSMKIARYESENKGHFGIASKYYCHFTSPIRRYPDLFIHRVISEYIQNNYNLSDARIDELQNKANKYAMTSSDCEKVATKAEREAEEIKKAEFMQDKIGEEYEGIVSSVTNFGMFVELDNTIEGLIRYENMGNEYYIYDEVQKKLIGERSKKTYKIGDKVKIRVVDANKELKKISFELVEEEVND